MLETSAYAKALQEMNIAALAACTDKVINPRCLTKDYPSKDIIFLSALHGLNSINCEEGLVYLPLTQFSALDCKVDSVEQLYQKLRRLCHITVARENDNICLEFSPYDSIMMYWDENKKFTEMLSFCFLRINHDNVYICLMSPFQNAEKWFHRYVKSPKNLAEDIYECQYSWGMIELEGDYIEITFNRANMTTEIKKTISKHALELLFP